MSSPSATAAVITTLYRGDDLDYFRVSVDSLCNQSYPRDSLRLYLYVDGPIPPAHEAALGQVADRFHRIVRGAVNKGLTHGLNTLIDTLENEEFVLRMDLDDVADPDRVTRQVAFLEAHPELQLIGCNSFEIDKHGKVVGQRDYPETTSQIRTGMARGNAMLHPAYCMRRSLLSEHGLRYRQVYLNEDLQFLFDVLTRDLGVANLQERLISWRVTDEFLARRHTRRHFVELQTYLRGLYALHGVTPTIAFPLIRFVFRLLPNSLATRVYRSGFRNRFLKG